MATKIYTPAPAGARETRGAARRWWVLAVASVAQLMVVLDVTVVNIALPSAQRALAFSDADRQWVVTAYALAFGSLLLIGGKLSDLLGRNRTFMAGLAGFAAASALAGAAPNFAVLAAGRAAQGAFGALLAPAALAIVTATFAGSPARGRAFAIFGAVAGIAGAVGLLLGGLLTEHLNWRWTLYVNLAFAAIWPGRRRSCADRTGRRTGPRSTCPAPRWSPPGCSCSCSGCPGPRTAAGTRPPPGCP
jgi:MFS family permease